MRQAICLPWALLCLASLSPAMGAQDAAKRERQRERDELQRDQARLAALEREQKSLQALVDRLEKQLPDARKRLDKLQDDDKSLDKDLAAARSDSDSAGDAAKAAQRLLADLVSRLESSQPAGSAFSQARSQQQAARDARTAAVDAVEKSAEYQAARAEALRSPAELLPALRKKWIDDNPAVAAASTRLLTAKATYDRLLDELLRGNGEWRKASGELQKARDKAAEKEARLKSLAARHVELNRTLTAARTEVKQMEASLSKAKNELPGLAKKCEQVRREIERDRRDLRNPRN